MLGSLRDVTQSRSRIEREEKMIKFMVDLRTSADAAAVAGIEELREVVAKLRADLDEVTGNPSASSGRFQ